MKEPFATVRVDLMRKALTAFYASAQKQKYKRGWSTKAGEAARGAVSGEYWLTQFAYEKRCHAFRNMMKNGVPKLLQRWVLPDGTLDDVLIAAVAIAPLRGDGKFRIKEFLSAVAKTPN
ncbi:MAG: hypothetical protein LAO20_14860 [Acidobacteriia bacterium]|nr:hypothetical protein [Terriglobia bacterium]